MKVSDYIKDLKVKYEEKTGDSTVKGFALACGVNRIRAKRLLEGEIDKPTSFTKVKGFYDDFKPPINVILNLEIADNVKQKILEYIMFDSDPSSTFLISCNKYEKQIIKEIKNSSMIFNGNVLGDLDTTRFINLKNGIFVDYNSLDISFVFVRNKIQSDYLPTYPSSKDIILAIADIIHYFARNSLTPTNNIAVVVTSKKCYEETSIMLSNIKINKNIYVYHLDLEANTCIGKLVAHDD